MSHARVARRIAITPGEPAGIGPDLVIGLLTLNLPVELVVIGDPDLLVARAAHLKQLFSFTRFDLQHSAALSIVPIPCRVPTAAGILDARNAEYVLATLDRAIAGCMAGEFDALVTGPVQKSIINDAGYPFTGHTEYLAQKTGSQPVMMLVARGLRVALVTTHLALRDVAAALTVQGVEYVIKTVADALVTRFDIPAPRIAVCGLNPHAGEHGHLGREEIDVIAPAIELARRAGIDVTGPVPADTIFVAPTRSQFDAFVCMFHDQGLPVLKALGFGEAVNVTLGLPFIRTSVDHGTALELAGSGRGDPGSLHAAIDLAISFCDRPARP